MRFALIDAKKAEFPVRTMCRVLDVSDSGFFAWKGRPASQRQRDDMIYLAHIRTAFELHLSGTVCHPRLQHDQTAEYTLTWLPNCPARWDHLKTLCLLIQ